ncbi:hypothetical protein S83_055272, partial [Arachis hypogaea]
RGSCGGKREEKSDGGTSGQGHSLEAETHDQESAARSREYKQGYEDKILLYGYKACCIWNIRSILRYHQ